MDLLREKRERASQECIDDINQLDPDTAPGIEEMDAYVAKQEAVADWDVLIDRALRYLYAIDDEIAKGETSRLRKDRDATKKTGVKHYTLASVDQWARSEFDISILNAPMALTNNKSAPEESLGDSSANGTAANQSGSLPKMEQEEGCSKAGLTKAKAENLLITFAFFVEEFSNTATKFMHNGKPNVRTIAEHFSERATKSRKGESFPGQSAEAIKTRIENALKIKNNPPI